MRIVFLGLSLSSSWGNGHATTYRALLSALAERGHELLFLERDQPWYAAQRDLPKPKFCSLALYRSVEELRRWRSSVRAADLVVVGSYVPEGVAVASWVQSTAPGVTAFYDIDTPVTLAALAANACKYLSPELIPGFDLYLSFTGGPTLQRLEHDWGARRARALYCAVDPALYVPRELPLRWDLGYLGTYSADRQPALERLLIEPARRRPELSFVVAGPQYPDGIEWPGNVERIEHLSPQDHAEFYSRQGWTLNVTRADMKQAGWSPSVRLFEAAACACPIVSDSWPGLGEILREGSEVALADTTDALLEVIESDARIARAVGQAGRSRVLASHTAAHRAAELEGLLSELPTRPDRVMAATV